MVFRRVGRIGMVVLIVALGGLQPARGDGSGPARAREGAGMRMYSDPATGAVGARPPDAATRQAAPLAQVEAGEAAEPLEAEPVRAAPGGVKINLRGRHRAAVTRQAGAGAAHQCIETGDAAR